MSSSQPYIKKRQWVNTHQGKQSMTQCPNDHVIRDFLSCDAQSHCGVTTYQKSCRTRDMDVPMFSCLHSHQTVHFTLVCDHVEHCLDHSDEEFCQYPGCSFDSFRCRNAQCIPESQICDLKTNCFDLSDEECTRMADKFSVFRVTADLKDQLPPPLKVDLDGTGTYHIQKLNVSECPVTHFMCPLGNCLPVYLRCNNVDDCPGREDEVSCETYTCPGLYRCWKSNVCLHPDYVCDGVWQCPHYDDEMLCNFRCPDVCHCQGLAFVCSHSFDTSFYPNIRYLHASGSEMKLENLNNSELLIQLNLSSCNIAYIPSDIKLKNLRCLDLSWNRISLVNLHSFSNMTNLLVLILSNNPLSTISGSEASSNVKLDVHSLDLSNTSIHIYNGSTLSIFPNLRMLNISNSKLAMIADEGLNSTPLVNMFDTRGSLLKHFPWSIFSNLISLKLVYSSHYKLCCSAILPGNFDPQNCYTDRDPLSSCEDLVRSDVYRPFIIILAFLAVVGNASNFIYRTIHRLDVGGFEVFVSSLSLADFLKGTYLTVLATADMLFRDEFLYHDDQWKESTACCIAGFLYLLSSEVSVFSIYLITVDRFLAIRLPHGMLQFRQCSANITCAIAWTVGTVLAAVPLLPVTSQWEFFRQTGVCIPLPFASNNHVHDHIEFFTMIIILNFVLFINVACFQAVIYRSLRTRSEKAITVDDTRDKDKMGTQRLTEIVVSNILCWFILGLMGILASVGVHIPENISVTSMMFLLPVNAGLDPVFYMYRVKMQDWKKAREERLLRMLQVRLPYGNQQACKHQLSETEQRALALIQIKTWLKRKVIKEDGCAACL